jgi:hypothetical protein
MIGKQPTAFREVDMAQTRRILLASLLLGLCVGTNPPAAEKKYDPGATDNEIKIGNIMPYSGPLSAYALIGRTEAAFLPRSTPRAASMEGRSTLLPTTPSAHQRPWNRRANWWRAMECCLSSRASVHQPTMPLVQVLKQCGDELTRENVMRQAANLKDFELGLLLPGIKINTSPTDYFPVEQMQMSRQR